MKLKRKRQISLLLCLVLLCNTCFSMRGITKQAQAAETKAEMRELTSMELLQDMTLGWNLGNSLDSCLADRDGDGVVDNLPADGTVDETLWGNIRTTPEIFATLKKQGINAVRIPVTWRDHLGEAPEYRIEEAWMERVQEVVDYAYDQGMYVIIDLHHDGGDDIDCGAWIRQASTDKEEVLRKYTAVWKQIAERFRDYSDYLIFESLNEVGFDDLRQAEGCALLNEINQTFVDLIRSSGGNNAKRHLLIGGYWTDISATSSGYFQMPDDPQNRCILSLHYYTPWEFCTTDVRKVWGTVEDGEEMQEKLDIVKENFLEKGIPVMIGEFGVGYGTEAESRIRFCGHLVSRCKAMGIPCFYWDNGEEFDRSKLAWRTEGLAEAMLQAAGVNPAQSEQPAPTDPDTTAEPVPSVEPAPSEKPVPSVNPTAGTSGHAGQKSAASPDSGQSSARKVGDTVKKGNGIYQITRCYGKTPGTVTYKKAANRQIRKLTIPATITIQNVTYRVTAIGKNACKGCKKLAKVTVGSNVKSIGAGAFKGCKKLKTVRIHTASLKTVGKKAFQGIHRKAAAYVPANQKKALRKKLKLKGTYKKQIVLNHTRLTVQQNVTVKALDTLKVIGRGGKVKWSSANRKIATVSSSGLVRGVSAGTTKVTARTGGKKLRCLVTVRKAKTVSGPQEMLPDPKPSTKPVAEPTAQPTSEPSAPSTPEPSGSPAVTASAEPSSTPVETEPPAWSPLPLFTSAPTEEPQGKSEEDRMTLTKLAAKYPNSGISPDPDSLEYGWNDDGRLSLIDWSGLTLDETLKVEGFPALETLQCSSSSITGLRLSDCPSLKEVVCNDNTSLQQLDLSGASGVTSLDCFGCENMTEVLLAEPDQIRSLSLGDMASVRWDFASYSALEKLTCQNMGLMELDIASLRQLKSVNCRNNEISSLTLPAGIEYVQCANNALTSLDTSQAEQLKELSCENNALSAVDLRNNKELAVLKIWNNRLTELELSANTRLTELYCQDNQLASLDLSGTDCLNALCCSNNQIAELKFGQTEGLLSLECASNQLTQLDVSHSEIQHLDCSDNPLVSLDVSACYLLQYLNFYHTDVTSLDVTELTKLKTIYCNSSDILIGWQCEPKDAADVEALESLIQQIQKTYEESGDMENQPAIDSDYLVSPQYTWMYGTLFGINWDHCSLTGNLDLGELKNLMQFSCSNNALEGLEISGCTLLETLDCRQNQITEIDASQNAYLKSILCDEGVNVITAEGETVFPDA